MSAPADRRFTRSTALAALTRLGEKLAARGVVADMYLVGGAAMALAYDAERFTQDIDAVFVPTTEVYQAAEVVGDELRLPSGWLNHAAKGFVPGSDPAQGAVLEMPGLKVTAASPEYLLGMKLLAARVERDRQDIRYLADLMDLATSAEVLAVIQRLYPVDSLHPRTRFLVEEMFPAQAAEMGGDPDAGRPNTGQG